MAMSTKLKEVSTGSVKGHDGVLLGRNTPECTIPAFVFALQQQKLWERVDNPTGVRCVSWICAPGPAFRIPWGKKG